MLDRVVSLAARSGTALRNAMQVQKLRHPLAPTVARAFERGAAER